MSNARTTKPAGMWEVSRKIRVPSLGQEADAMVLVPALEGLAGVRKVTTDTHKRCVVVRYDAAEIGYNALVSVLEMNGYPPSTSWWSNLKANWFQFTDSNARENANLPAPPCCNKPPK